MGSDHRIGCGAANNTNEIMSHIADYICGYMLLLLLQRPGAPQALTSTLGSERSTNARPGIARLRMTRGAPPQEREEKSGMMRRRAAGGRGDQNAGGR